VQEEGEVEAVEACLRFMYTGELPATPSVKQLLAVQRMADYVGIMECCSACLAALCALQPEALSVDDAVSLGYSDGVPEHLRTQQLKALCRSALLHHLGDVVAVMRDEEGLRGHMLKLPHGALLDLLRSEALATDSEDSVVAAVSAWADANEASVAQLRQLAAELRLLQLSAAYFYHALPVAAWAGPEVLPPPSLMQLAAYAHGDAHAKDEVRRVTALEQDVQLPGAEAKRRAFAMCKTLGWEPPNHDASDAAAVWHFGVLQVAESLAYAYAQTKDFAKAQAWIARRTFAAFGPIPAAIRASSRSH
jgi:hypothetical protein